MVPGATFIASPLALTFYANRRESRSPNYILVSDDEPVPEGRQVASEDGVSLYVVDDDLWKKHRALSPATPPMQGIFGFERAVLFKGSEIKSFYVINLKSIAISLGLLSADENS